MARRSNTCETCMFFKWDSMDGPGVCALSKLIVWPLDACLKWKLRTTYKH